jgi:hypothetical protein
MGRNSNEKIVPVQLLRTLLYYNAETGDLVWAQRAREYFKTDRSHKIWNKRFADQDALTSKTTFGYFGGSVLGQSFLAHRVAFAIHHGHWPNGVIDHINHNPRDNRAANLRDVTRTENLRNQRIHSNNKSGATGVFRKSNGPKWVAKVRVDNKDIHLGYFDQFDEAVAARAAANSRYNFHKNHGKTMSS